ncbi:MAG TPA: (2Fe-2S)-binding protein [Polyangiaceae bacterium]|nr:(2Fe-2S)-binding protein [Polyangiaceae bacterium]
MIVCHCHGVTDREIRQSVQNGSRTCADVAECCGAGLGCGGCASLVAEIVQGERRRLAVVKSDVAASPFACLGPLADSTALQSA